MPSKQSAYVAARSLARLRRIRLFWLLSLLCAGNAFAAGVDCLPTEVPGYARPKASSLDSVVVFVHGLHGDGRTTWTTSNWISADTAWPCLMLKDAEHFPGTSIYLASYRSVTLGESPRVQRVAKELAADLVRDGVFAYANVTFVAHSMGGLVVARMLTDDGLLTPNQRQRIRLVLFAGTPAQPTEAAAICAKWGINSAQCSDMSDEVQMTELWKRWASLPVVKRPPIWCVAEGKDMPWFGLPPWLRIVPEPSAHHPCASHGVTHTALGFDHSELVKPASAASRPHGLLQAAFGGCVKRHLRKTALAEEEEPFAMIVRDWLNGFVSRLVAEDSDWRSVVDNVVAVAPKRRGFFFPDGGRDRVESAQYVRLTSSGLFADEVDRVLKPVLMKNQIAWARPIDRLSARLADGQVEALIADLRSSGDFQQGDLLVALPVWDRQPDVLWLLAVRPGAGADGQPGLVGVLALPLPQACPN